MKIKIQNNSIIIPEQSVFHSWKCVLNSAAWWTVGSVDLYSEKAPLVTNLQKALPLKIKWYCDPQDCNLTEVFVSMCSISLYSHNSYCEMSLFVFNGISNIINWRYIFLNTGPNYALLWSILWYPFCSVNSCKKNLANNKISLSPLQRSSK